jgi:hypothetical protein
VIIGISTCAAQEKEPDCWCSSVMVEGNVLSLELVYCFATDSRSAHDDNEIDFEE